MLIKRCVSPLPFELVRLCGDDTYIAFVIFLGHRLKMMILLLLFAKTDESENCSDYEK